MKELLEKLAKIAPGLCRLVPGNNAVALCGFMFQVIDGKAHQDDSDNACARIRRKLTEMVFVWRMQGGHLSVYRRKNPDIEQTAEFSETIFAWDGSARFETELECHIAALIWALEGK